MKILFRFMLLIAVLIIPATVFGQGSGSYPSPPPSKSEGIREESNFVVTRSATGTVAGFKEGILTIKMKKDKEIRVALTAKTKFLRGKQKLDAKELDENSFKEGQAVKVTYQPLEKPSKLFEAIALEVRFPDEKMKKDKPKIGE